MAVPENPEYIKVPLLSDDISKNKNIHYYYKRNDKKYADMQQLLTKVFNAVINIANNYLEADSSNKIVELRALVTKAADAITIMGKLNTMPANDRKIRLKQALSESYQGLCDQDFSQSVYLLGDNLPEELRKAKSQHFLATTLKRQKTGSGSIRKDLALVVSLQTTRAGRKIIQSHSINNRDRIKETYSTDIKKGTDSRTSKRPNLLP